MLIIACFITILFIPSIAEAWGPLTHVYLGHQIIDLGAAIVPAGIYSLIKRHKKDFLYGNLSADIILGRKFQLSEKNSHNWDIAWKIFDIAKTDRQKSFAYGYLTHLCADTVVHNLKGPRSPFKHSILEVKADSIVNKKYNRLMKDLDKITQKKNDLFLEEILESVFFSFKTNKRIFKGILLLSRLPNYTPVSNFIHKRLPYEIPVMDIHDFRQESLLRMFEILKNGKNSKVLREHPLGRHQRKTFLN
ncbi:MAG: zinc dependent phospholipase C family protein [Nitrospirae bacterium]|nr:zinc dependent phospholipase C family protein [Nitrospirota bacterium]